MRKALALVGICVAALGLAAYQTNLGPTNFPGLVTMIGGEVNTGAAGLLGTAQVCTNCWGNTPSLSIRRQDNSAPIGGVDIGTAFLDPIVEIRSMPSTAGTFVGSQTPLALVMANVSNKDYITLTQSVTLSASPQTVSVSDSSVISTVADSNGFLNNQLNIDFGKGTAETVSVTAIPDSTHVTAIFSQNHANGANAHGVFNTGFHLGMMLVVGDNTANKTDILGMNINVTCNATANPGACNGIEMDTNVSSGLRAAAYSGEDSTHRLVWGFYHAMNAGIAGGVTDSFLSYSLDGITNANNGFMCVGCAKNNAFAITANSVADRPINGLAIQGVTGRGVNCGSNQTAAENPSWTLIDPLDCLYLTSQGAGSFTQSNFLTFESNASSVTHTFSEVFHYNAGGLFFLIDTHTIDTNNYTDIGTDGYFNTSNAGGAARGYRLRSSNLIIAKFENLGTAATLAAVNTGTLAVIANNLTFPEGTAPTASNNNDVCYGDSTAHGILCSFNNGSFLQLAQDIRATSAAFATATTAGSCVQNTTAVSGATTSMAVSVSPQSTPGVGAQWSAFVSSAGNVTITECAVAVSAGGTIAFNIRLIQ